ncbi:MAG: hypothetical protein ACPLGZ_00035 [Candidatus Pelagibacter ubique]
MMGVTMSNILKTLIILAPVTAVILYYVVVKQTQVDEEMRRQEIQYEQEWNRFSKDFVFTNPEDRAYYEQRNKELQKEMEEIKKREQEQKEKARKFEEELEKELKNQNN